MNIEVVGIDAAFANMGFARALLEGSRVSLKSLHLEVTESEKKLGVRVSSDSLRRAQQLHRAMQTYCQGCVVAFAEVPTGSQSAAAAKALGIATGVLGGCPVEIIEVSPMEVKEAVSGSRKINPTKPQIIAWATSRWPAAPWLRDRKGRLLNANEHLADAAAIIIAGLQTPAWKQLMRINKNEVTGPDLQRPASGRVRLL